MYHQRNDYMKDKLSKQFKGFRKNHSAQHCLSYMLEIWKKVLDRGGYLCAIFMDLSKAFDTLNHDLLTAQLGAYGLETDALRYMKSYLTNRKQRLRVNKTFSAWEKITTGVPPSSLLGPLLFNIFLNDFFLFIWNSSLSNYADDNTLSEIIWQRSRIIYQTALIRCINGSTKILWCLMQKNVILCVSGITLKTKHFCSITSLWKIAKNKKISVL